MASLVMANIIGITKFWAFTVPLWNYEVQVPVGILPYPVTFLATDLVCELYGRRRANFLVLVGFLMNLFLLLVCWVGHAVPDSESWRNFVLSDPAQPDWYTQVFERVWSLMVLGVAGSMAAYTVAQFVDVQLFHFWKRLTRGKHLWLRNNASTMLSQLVDTTIIICILFGQSALDGELSIASPFGGQAVGLAALGVFIFNGYLFKVFFAAFDTPLVYLGRRLLAPLVGGPDPGEPRYAVAGAS